MISHNKPSRRTALKTGLASIAASSVVVPKAKAAVRQKVPGETKIVAVMGDYWHPAVSQEHHIRGIFSSKKDFKIYFVQASRYFTPELISDADLFISARYGGRDSIGWSTDPVVVDRPQGDIIWTDEQTEAVFDNVRSRGMGWMAVHCTLFSGRKDIEDFIGIEPILHQEI